MSNSLWLITDGKPGHLAQLRGLGERLSARARMSPCWINAQAHPLPWWRGLRAGKVSLPQEAPTLIVGAGRTTHRLLLALSRYHGVPAVVLMRPSLPLALFDAAIIPAHDRPPKREHILITEGVLNDVQPLARLTPEPSGLILVGGPSRHYLWQEQALRDQILTIANEAPDWQWHVTDSRRTPGSFLKALSGPAPPNLHLHSRADTPTGWVRERLAESRCTWVTPDSTSMVFEALTAGVPTGLLSLPERKKGRITGAMNRLIDTGRVTAWPSLPATDSRQTELWEADRAARWLMDRFPQQLRSRS